MKKLVLLLTCAIAGCSDSDSPEAQIRKTIDAMEHAAEERSVSGVAEHISPQFRDANSRDANELSQYIRGFFVANQSIHLLTRVGTIEFPTNDEAQAQITVAMVGREGDEANAWNLAGEIYDFDVTFRREDDEWKVIYAKWKRPGS